MSPSLQKLKDQVKKLFGSMSKRALVLIAVLVLGTGGLLAYLAMADRTEYGVLFTGLATEDASRITEQLRKSRTLFRLEAGGTTVLVPSEKVHEIRLTMAGQGLPRGGGVGFEIFDSQKFGVSEFAQQINYRRALQGELERTISQLDAVQAARVHLALPERAVFARRGQPASAAVTLRLHPGRSLAPASVRAVVHLVSSSETGLSPDQVTVVDTAGNMLWSGREGPFGSGGPLDQKRTMEESLERRVSQILDAAVGAGHSVVKVSAEVGLAQVEQTETQYDPESAAVRSETGLEEKDARPGAVAGGIPGVQGNLPGGPAPATGSADAVSQRKSFTRNYEVTKKVRKQLSPAGEVKRISVAALVDSRFLTGEPVKGAAAKKGASAAASPRVDLAALEQVVKQAVGFTPARGDVVTLRTIYFAPEQELAAPPVTWLTRVTREVSEYAKPAAVVILALVVLTLLLKARRRSAEPPTVLALPRTVRELEAAAAPQLAGASGDATAVATASIAAARANLPAPAQSGWDLARAAAEHDAARTASILKAWMEKDG